MCRNLLHGSSKKWSISIIGSRSLLSQKLAQKLEESALLRTEVSPKTARRLERLMTKLPVKEQMGKCFDEAAKSLKREAANDPRYSLLLKLMSEADKKVPGISMIIVSQRHGDLIQSLEAQCAVI